MSNELNINVGKQKLIVYIVLIIAALVVYWQVSQFDFLNYDDPVYVTENSHIQSGITLKGIDWAFSTTHAEFWHPLTWLSLMFDYELYGLNAGGYHVTNIILHILSVLLLFRLFHRMTGALWKSAFVAAFFALHPLRVESIAWISERKDVLSAFFWMLTLCLYVYYVEKPAIKRYLLVLFSFICGLMSKPMLVTLPVIMILLDYWPLKRFESQKGSLFLWQLREKIIFFIVSAVFSIITIYAQPGISTNDLSFPLESRIINALGSFVVYIGKTFWPGNLTVCYPFIAQAPAWQVSGAVLLILAVSAAVILANRRWPYLFAGWFWYAVALLPVIGIIPGGYNAMADRYVYLPSIGIAIMMAWGVPLLFKSENLCKKILFPAALAFLIIMSVLTWKQCGYWRDSLTLFSHALHVNSHNYHAHINVASYLVKENNFKEALYYYDKAIEIKPDKADAYNNRGIVYAKMGRYQLAIDDFNKAISLQPDNANIFTNRATFYLNQGNEKLGCKDARKACDLGNCSILDIAQGNGHCR
ncbi:MAG: tetratricopeptide repeat protein [Deltaproteobacteria bacterium]|nr:tetratricopeptide repeat protein [Deltaproteobacteria bacterium]